MDHHRVVYWDANLDAILYDRFSFQTCNCLKASLQKDWTNTNEHLLYYIDIDYKYVCGSLRIPTLKHGRHSRLWRWIYQTYPWGRTIDCCHCKGTGEWKSIGGPHWMVTRMVSWYLEGSYRARGIPNNLQNDFTCLEPKSYTKEATFWRFLETIDRRDSRD